MSDGSELAPLKAEREHELLDRIRHLEEQNSALQDRLDMIWAILAPDYDISGEEEQEGDDDEGGLVQIEGLK